MVSYYNDKDDISVLWNSDSPFPSFKATKAWNNIPYKYCIYIISMSIIKENRRNIQQYLL